MISNSDQDDDDSDFVYSSDDIDSEDDGDTEESSEEEVQVSRRVCSRGRSRARARGQPRGQSRGQSSGQPQGQRRRESRGRDGGRPRMRGPGIRVRCRGGHGRAMGFDAQPDASDSDNNLDDARMDSDNDSGNEQHQQQQPQPPPGAQPGDQDQQQTSEEDEEDEENLVPVFHWHIPYLEAPDLPQFRARPGVLVDTTEMHTPIDYFSYFVNDELLDYWVEHTNLYGEQYLRDHPNLRPYSEHRKWAGNPTNREEMKVFLGLTLLMGLIKNLGSQTTGAQVLS